MCLGAICKSIQDMYMKTCFSFLSFQPCLGQTSSHDFFYTDSLHKLFVESPISPDYKTITFQNMATINDFWQVIRYY